MDKFMIRRINLKMKLVDFWCAVYNEYPKLSINTIKKLLLFPTIYLCEKGFSIMANIKTKQRNRLDVTHVVGNNLSEIEPQWEILCNHPESKFTLNSAISYYTNFLYFYNLFDLFI